MNKLTDTKCKQAKPREKRYRLGDGDGLCLIVEPSGGTSWEFRYRFNCKDTTLHPGPYPEIPLKEARRQREIWREMVARGVDPKEDKQARREAAIIQARKEADTFKNVAEQWFEFWKNDQGGKSEKSIKNVRLRLDNYVLPVLGGKLVADIDGPAILESLRPIEAQGKFETARRVRTYINMILDYAIAMGKRTLFNPCPSLSKVLLKAKVKHHAALFKPEEIGELLRAIDGYKGQGPVVRAALRLAPLIFCRIGELRHMRWTEINFEQAEWRFIASKVKREQIVPLSRQAVTILQELKVLSLAGPFVFPGLRGASRPISDMTLNRALQSLGYDTQQQLSGHGFRRMASTLLNEQGYNRDWVERQLSHLDGTVRGDYNAAEYLAGRRDMMQAWADYLDTLREVKD